MNIQEEGHDDNECATRPADEETQARCVEATKRCSLEAIEKVKMKQCCKRRCIDRFDAAELQSEREKYAYVEGSTARGRNGRMEYLFEFCRDHGMLKKEDSCRDRGKFIPILYGKPVCWNALSWFLGISKSRVNEIAKMARNNIKHVQPRYEKYSSRNRDLAGQAMIYDFVADIFRTIGEYQPDSYTIILPFPTRVLLCQYLRAKWEDQYNQRFPSDKTICRYLRSEKALSAISPQSFGSTVHCGQENSEGGACGFALRVALRRTPRFGKCPDCCESQLALSHTRCKADRHLFLARYNLHLDSVRKQRLVYYSLKAAAIRDPDELLTIIADGPDQYITRLPHMGPAWGGRAPKFDDSVLPKLKLELVVCHGRRGPNIFLYAAPPDKSHGANMVIESLERTFALLKNSDGIPKSGHVHIQLDNPTGENKNRYVFAYLAELIYREKLRVIDIGFLPPSHTHEDVDMRHSQYCRYLANHKFVDAEDVCRLVEQCLSSYTPSAPATGKALKRQRLESDPHSGDIMLRFKKTMADKMYSERQVFIPRGTLDQAMEPPSEAAHYDRHDERAADTLERMSRSSPLLWPPADVKHAIELQRGSYKYLSHEDSLDKLPRFVLDTSTQQQPPSSERCLTSTIEDTLLSSKANAGVRQGLQGSTLVGESMSSNPADRAIFSGLANRELKYSKPAKVVIRQKGEAKGSLNFKKYSVSDDGSRLAISSLSQLRVDELPKAGYFAFVRVVGGLHPQAKACPAIARVVKVPDWSVVSAESRADQEIAVHWYAFDDKLINEYGIAAVARGVCQPMVQSKKRKGAKADWWMDNILLDTLLAWNFNLTGNRHLPRAALKFLEQDLTLDVGLATIEEEFADENAEPAGIDSDTDMLCESKARRKCK